jgi:hypothetical protein
MKTHRAAQLMSVGVVAAGLAVGLPAVAGAAPAAERICPPGFGAPQTLQDVLIRYAGSYTEAEILAGFASRDLNRNGLVCAKPISSHDKAFPLQQFFAVDDLSEPVPPRGPA